MKQFGFILKKFINSFMFKASHLQLKGEPQDLPLDSPLNVSDKINIELNKQELELILITITSVAIIMFIPIHENKFINFQKN